MKFNTTMLLCVMLAATTSFAAPKAATKTTTRTTTVTIRDVTPESTMPRDDRSQIIAGPTLAFSNGVTLFGVTGEFVAPVGPKGLMIGAQSGFMAGSFGGYAGYGGVSYGMIPILGTAIYRFAPTGTIRPWIGASLGPVIGFAGGNSGVGFGANMKGGITINRWNIGTSLNFGGEGGALFALNGGYVFNL